MKYVFGDEPDIRATVLNLFGNRVSVEVADGIQVLTSDGPVQGWVLMPTPGHEEEFQGLILSRWRELRTLLRRK